VSIIKAVKFCIFIATCVVLIFYGIAAPMQGFKLENYFRGVHAFYSAQHIESPYVTDTIDLGFSRIYKTSSDNARSLRNKFSHIDGESVTLHNYKSTRSILNILNARKVSTSQIGDISIVYAFSPNIPTFITKSGRKINIQIAQRPAGTKIGWPVILGSF